jgi:DNA-binding NtrC family response regulator/AraC-like DNA-binding protein
MERTGAMHATVEGFGRVFGHPEEATLSGAVRSESSSPWNRAERIEPRGGHTVVWPMAAQRSESESRAAREIFPLVYGGRDVGVLTLTFPERLSRDTFAEIAAGEAVLAALALMREQLTNRAWNLFNLELLLSGQSRAELVLEMEIEKVSSAAYPVVLECAFGCNPVRMAAAIHLARCGEDESLIVVDGAYRDAASVARELEQALEQASGGTLLLADVDLLDAAAQRQVLRVLRQMGSIPGRTTPVRILVSASAPLDELVRQDRFCALLQAELDYLHVRVPPLRDRREDIPLLMAELLELRSAEGATRRLSREAEAACQLYDWPGNERELERVATRLAVMSDGPVIGMEQLQRVVPWVSDRARGDRCGSALPTLENTSAVDYSGDVLGGVLEVERRALSVERSAADAVEEAMVDFDLAMAGAVASVESAALQVEDSAAELSVAETQGLGDLPRKLAARDYSDLTVHGVGVQRALRFVGNHYTEDISLGRLARESYISSSHLSFLLKRSLGVPFKSLLAAVRIERAQQMLTQSEPSITEISLEVGFGDLSHFERTFKRIVGVNPREYRRQQLELQRQTGSPTARAQSSEIFRDGTRY